MPILPRFKKNAYIDGTASMAFTGGGALSMIVPFEGTGSVASVTGAADLRGVLSMAGGWTPFTDLSPEGLAQAWPGALRGSFSSTFTSTPADLMLLVRQVAPENPTQGSSHCTNTRRRHPPVHEDTRKRARRRADEELLLAIL